MNHEIPHRYHNIVAEFHTISRYKKFPQFRVASAILLIWLKFQCVIAVLSALFMPPSGQTDRQRHIVFNVSAVCTCCVHPFVHLFPNFRTWYFENEWAIFLTVGTSVSRGKSTELGEENGDMQTLMCDLAARLRRCPTLSNLVHRQSWMAAYPGCTLQMQTLFPGWPIMVHDMHTRRRRRAWDFQLWSQEVKDRGHARPKIIGRPGRFSTPWAEQLY